MFNMRVELKQFSESSKGLECMEKGHEKSPNKNHLKEELTLCHSTRSEPEKKSTFGSAFNETFAQYANRHNFFSIHRPYKIKLRGSLNILVERKSGKSLVRQTNSTDIAELILSSAHSIRHRNCTSNSIRDSGQVKPVPIVLRYLYSFYT